MKLVLIAAAALALAAGTASAQDASVVAGSSKASAAVSSQSKKDANPACLRQTGSHIAPVNRKPNSDRAVDCATESGRVYTRQDIRRSGATTTADALRTLDPSIH